jgi:uncharacterized RDD family membrane protein YckC
MGCPQCQSEDISDSGICLVCGYVTSIDSDAQESESPAENEINEADSGNEDIEAQGDSGSVEADEFEAEETEKQEGKPSWRLELSQRLQAIKQKREATDPAQPQTKPKPVPKPATQAAKPAITSAARSLEMPPASRPLPKPRVPLPKQKTLQPLEPEMHGEKPVSREVKGPDVQTLIDNAVLGRPVQPSEAAPAAEYSGPEVEFIPDDEGKLILLSRTLSGLIDLIVVLLCSGMCIIAADFFSGVIALDSGSYLIFSLLFLLTYLFYSLFFLSASNQTVGMMITDLHVVDEDGKRPSISQLIRRCFGFVASVLVVGLGLLWSLFDQENRCFHDRISDTRVLRL